MISKRFNDQECSLFILQLKLLEERNNILSFILPLAYHLFCPAVKCFIFIFQFDFHDLHFFHFGCKLFISDFLFFLHLLFMVFLKLFIFLGLDFFVFLFSCHCFFILFLPKFFEFIIFVLDGSCHRSFFLDILFSGHICSLGQISQSFLLFLLYLQSFLLIFQNMLLQISILTLLLLLQDLDLFINNLLLDLLFLLK